MPNGLGTTKETFEGYSTDSKLNTLFDFAVTTHEDVQALKKRKKYDTALSIMIAAVTGFFGGLFGGGRGV